MRELKLVKSKTFAQDILPDVTAINLSEQEIIKLKVYLRESYTYTNLFSSITDLHNIISANFTKPSKIIIIPYMNNGREHINIQRI